MEKVSDFLLKHSEGKAAASASLPVLSPEEEEEILDQMGVAGAPDASTTPLDLILSTVTNVIEFSLATGDAAKEAENDEDYADYGTVIIKTKSGMSKQGTLRVKKGGDRFGSIIFRGGDVEASDLPTDAFSTMRVIETAAGDDASPPWASASQGKEPASAGNEGNFFWRAPEEWEVNIIALERGEWKENMPEDAFRKYKKERPKLGGLFRGESKFYDATEIRSLSASSPSILSEPKPSTSSASPSLESTSAPTSPRIPKAVSSDKVKKRKSSKKNKSIDRGDKTPKDKDKSDKSDKSSEKDKSDKAEKADKSEKAEKLETPRSEKGDKGDKEKTIRSSSATGQSSSSTPSSRQERRWAVFKRSAAQRQKVADS